MKDSGALKNIARMKWTEKYLKKKKFPKGQVTEENIEEKVQIWSKPNF